MTVTLNGHLSYYGSSCTWVRAHVLRVPSQACYPIGKSDMCVPSYVVSLKNDTLSLQYLFHVFCPIVVIIIHIIILIHSCGWMCDGLCRKCRMPLSFLPCIITRNTLARVLKRTNRSKCFITVLSFIIILQNSSIFPDRQV